MPEYSGGRCFLLAREEGYRAAGSAESKLKVTAVKLTKDLNMADIQAGCCLITVLPMGHLACIRIEGPFCR